ncbi:hypothetical protein FQN57_002390 [Myotisia sp. PD_48]|nr:hypothetical protein FQN57_002390 [Myotisia sp. PD_48]
MVLTSFDSPTPPPARALFPSISLYGGHGPSTSPSMAASAMSMNVRTMAKARSSPSRNPSACKDGNDGPTYRDDTAED